MFFVIDQRNNLVKANGPDTKFEDIGRMLGESWKSLPDVDRRQYISKSNEDKVRYQQEMAAYNQTRAKPAQVV